jgi:hypothetical protein
LCFHMVSISPYRQTRCKRRRGSNRSSCVRKRKPCRPRRGSSGPPCSPPWVKPQSRPGLRPARVPSGQHGPEAGRAKACSPVRCGREPKSPDSDERRAHSFHCCGEEIKRWGLPIYRDYAGEGSVAGSMQSQRQSSCREAEESSGWQDQRKPRRTASCWASCSRSPVGRPPWSWTYQPSSATARRLPTSCSVRQMRGSIHGLDDARGLASVLDGAA